MTTFTKIVILITFISFGCQSANKEIKETPIDFKDLTEKLDEYFKTLSKIKKFNGGVLIQKEGKTVLYDIYKMEIDEQSSLQISKNSQFDIHSISKLMAKACIVKLEAEKLINRDDKVNKYIPDFPNGEEITIQNLMDNQSGLPREFSKEYANLIEKNPDEIVGFIKQEALLFKPGSETLYSNLGYQLLYFIISKIANKPFVQYIDDNFFKPLQMNNSGAHFHLNKDNLSYLVKNHENDDGKIVVVPNINSDGKNQAKIYSTLSDLLKFIDYVKTEPYITALKDKNDMIGWSGGGDGILSHAKASLKSGYEIIFFSNYDDIPFGDILDTVEKIMTNQPYELPKEINRQSIKLDRGIMEKYVGKYRVKEFNNDVFEFRIENDSLIFYQNGERNTVLNAENDSTFFDLPNSEEFFVFRKLRDGDFELIFNYKRLEIVGNKMDSK